MRKLLVFWELVHLKTWFMIQYLWSIMGWTSGFTIGLMLSTGSTFHNLINFKGLSLIEAENLNFLRLSQKRLLSSTVRQSPEALLVILCRIVVWTWTWRSGSIGPGVLVQDRDLPVLVRGCLIASVLLEIIRYNIREKIISRIVDTPYKLYHIIWLGWIQGFLGFSNSVYETWIWKAQIICKA